MATTLAESALHESNVIWAAPMPVRVIHGEAVVWLAASRAAHGTTQWRRSKPCNYKFQQVETRMANYLLSYSPKGWSPTAMFDMLAERWQYNRRYKWQVCGIRIQRAHVFNKGNPEKEKNNTHRNKKACHIGNYRSPPPPPPPCQDPPPSHIHPSYVRAHSSPGHARPSPNTQPRPRRSIPSLAHLYIRTHVYRKEKTPSSHHNQSNQFNQALRRSLAPSLASSLAWAWHSYSPTQNKNTTQHKGRSARRPQQPKHRSRPLLRCCRWARHILSWKATHARAQGDGRLFVERNLPSPPWAWLCSSMGPLSPSLRLACFPLAAPVPAPVTGCACASVQAGPLSLPIYIHAYAIPELCLPM